MKILGIETSCDETAAAIVEDGHKILSNVVVSQIDIHAAYGGVVPEIAARSHIEAVQPVLEKALKDANLRPEDLDAIAVTNTPGLVGASSSHILLQFLFESIILSLIGGVMGFALGYIFAFLISLITPFAPHISWQILAITGTTSLTVGVIFGVYPAIKAARKDPITSLKYYR